MRFYSLLIVSLGFLLGVVRLSAQTIHVDEVLVSDENAADVLAGKGKGKAGCVRYDKASNTLFLQDASLDKGLKVVGLEQELTVKIDGQCSIVADPFGLITNCFVTFTGESGKLVVKAKSSESGGFAMDGAHAIIRFKDCDVEFKSAGASFAVASLRRGYGLLVFDHSEWLSDGGLVGAMGRINIKRSDIKLPVGGMVAYKQPQDSDDPPFANILDADRRPNYGTFKLDPNNKYPISIDDVDVTEKNATNIFPNSVIPNGYARYNPEKNRLIISNLDFFTMGTSSIQNYHDETDLPLTIEVRGFNTIWSGYNSCIYSRGPLVITGDGNLHVKTEDVKIGSAGIFMENGQPLTIEKTRVYATGFYGLAGGRRNTAKLFVKDAYLEMNCTRPQDGACMEGFESMDLENVAIIEPKDAHFDAFYSGLLLADNTPARGRVIIGNAKWQAIQSPLADDADNWCPSVSVQDHTLTIDLEGQPSIALARLFDLNGAVLAHFAPRAKVSLNLPSGCYVLSVGSYNQKILIP